MGINFIPHKPLTWIRRTDVVFFILWKMGEKVKICYKCKEIITFCECEESITDKDRYIEYLESKILD